MTTGSDLRQHSPKTLLCLTAPALAVAALLVIAWEATAIQQIRLARHCGFDGAMWCSMAEGGLAHAPYHRRFLLPFAVRAIDFGNVVSRFVVINIVACTAIAVLTGLLTRRFAGLLHASEERTRSAPLFAGALTGFSVYTWRYTFMVPVNTDVAGAALVLAWLLIVTARGSRISLLSPFVAAMAVMTRDMNGPSLLAAALALLLLGRNCRLLAFLNALAIAAAAYVTTLIPAVPGSTSSIEQILLGTARANFGSLQGVVIYVWLVATGLGFVAILALPTLRWALRPVFTPAWVLVLSGVLIASFFGGTTDRYLLAPMAVLVAMAVAYVASSPRWDTALLLLSVASVALWRPWLELSGDVEQILRVYNPYIQPWSVNSSHLLLDLRNIAIGVVVVGALMVGRQSWRRRRAVGGLRSL